MFVAGIIYLLDSFGLDLGIQIAFWQVSVDMELWGQRTKCRAQNSPLFNHYIIASASHLPIALSILCRIY